MSHEFSRNIGWVHIAVGRLNDVCGMCKHYSVRTTVNINSSHTFLLSQTGMKIREIIFHKSLRNIVLPLPSKYWVIKI